MSTQHQLVVAVPTELVEHVADRLAELVREQANQIEEGRTSQWLNVTDATAYLGCTRNTLYRLTSARAIPFRKKRDGQGLLFHRDELDRWVEDHYSREGVRV